MAIAPSGARHRDTAVTRYRLPWRTRLRQLWRRLTGRIIPYRDDWLGESLDLDDAGIAQRLTVEDDVRADAVRVEGGRHLSTTRTAQAQSARQGDPTLGRTGAAIAPRSLGERSTTDYATAHGLPGDAAWYTTPRELAAETFAALAEEA